jgi:ABC-2 type transport system ATP-binding protein
MTDQKNQTEPILKIENLVVQRNEIEVLKSLTLELKQGEILGLLGPNGSGKSSTFSVLSGLLQSKAGQIYLQGQKIEGGAYLLRKKTGFVFQNPSLDVTLSARENLDLTAQLYRIPKAKRQEIVGELLRFADLTDRADEKVQVYSGGMKRRLELARALVHEPEILVMDEPTTGLDEISFQRTWQKLRQLRQDRGLSILLSTHRPEEAAFCDRVAFINDGHLVECDTPSALQTKISGDHLLITSDQLDEVKKQILDTFELDGKITESQLDLHCENAHLLIPKLVEALQGKIRSIQMTRPNLGDVFLKVTGHHLADDRNQFKPTPKA